MIVLSPFWSGTGSRAVVVGNKDFDFYGVADAPRHMQMTKSPSVFGLLSFHKHCPASVTYVQMANSQSDGGDGIIVICKKVGVGLCAPPSLLVFTLRKLGAVPPNVDRSCI